MPMSIVFQMEFCYNIKMDQKQILETTKNAEELYQVVMQLYMTYLDYLEKVMERIPETETEILRGFSAHLQEVQGALEHDMGLFDKAVSQDKEDLKKIQDQLKIQDLYKSLND